MSDGCKILKFTGSKKEQANESHDDNGIDTRPENELLRGSVRKQTIDLLGFINDCLGKGQISIFLDPKHEDVRVPARFKGDDLLCLNFSRRFDPPNLEVSKKGISQTLTFQGESFDCFVPYEAFLALECDTIQTFVIFDEKMLQYLQFASKNRQS